LMVARESGGRVGSIEHMTQADMVFRRHTVSEQLP
jgi:hypothetical protein